MEREGAALGTGIRFPVQFNDRGGIAVSEDEEKIAQSIRIILSTAKGERVMRPDFGCDIHEFAFASMDRTTCTMVESAVREALVLWEPRIEVEFVKALPDHGMDGKLRIGVTYRIRATNTEFNLVYPFHVRAGG